MAERNELGSQKRVYNKNLVADNKKVTTVSNDIFSGFPR